MIRPMQSTDAPDLLALLHWMDDAPEREVCAPDARDLRGLLDECGDSTCLVDVGEDGVRAYCALAPFRDGLVLEGPLMQEGGHLGSLLGRALERADGQPIYAFAARDNTPARAALEACGFTPMHSTAFYRAPLEKLAVQARVPDGLEVVSTLPLKEYRALYRAAEDAWADRLDWTPEQFDVHFAQPDIRLVALRRGAHAVGFAELHLRPEDARADLTHLAVHPAERREGHGRTLLALAAAEASTHPEVRTLRARAHDHMHAARTLYTRAGLSHCRSVVTYLREDTEEA